MMKKITLIIAAAFAALAFSSCQKEAVLEPAQENQTLKVNIDVDAITKAAKKGWTAGDKINIFFDARNVDAPVAPDLTITYDGSKWEAGALRGGLALQATGLFTCFYEANNDLNTYDVTYYSAAQWYTPKNSTYLSDADNRAYPMPLTMYKESVAYTYDAGENTLTATIPAMSVLTTFKVLIPTDDALAGNAYDWFLQVKNETKDKYASTNSSLNIRNDATCAKTSYGSANYYGFAAGVQESDGIAFYYTGLGSAWNSGDVISFSLRNGASGRVVTYHKTLDADFALTSGVCTGVFINYSKFHLRGAFSVNNSGKTVYFSPGDLYWNGTKFSFEQEQHVVTRAWDPNHVVSFWFDTDPAKAVGQMYTFDAGTAARYDVLFAHKNANVMGTNWEVPTTAEWNYLMSVRGTSDPLNTKYRNGVTVDGTAYCIILAPDSNTTPIASSYTLSEWLAAEKEHDFVLFTGGVTRYNNTGAVREEKSMGYWEQTASVSDDQANFLFWNGGLAGGRRYECHNVRLMTE